MLVIQTPQPGLTSAENSICTVAENERPKRPVAVTSASSR